MTGALIFLYGLCVGSFLNVCIWRLPRGRSLLMPPSHCPRCRHRLAWRDNIPVASYLLLLGRCRSCRGRISPRYPLVELLTGGLCLGLWWRWSAAGWWFVPASASAAALVAVAFIDWETFLIPDVLSLGLLASGVAAAPLNPCFSGGPLWRAGASLWGAAFGFALCWAVAALGERIFQKEAMGGGDVKLLAAVGAWTGALGAFNCLMLGSFIGAVYGLGLILRGRIRRRDPVPFGPFLSAGAAVNLFYVLPPGFPFVF